MKVLRHPALWIVLVAIVAGVPAFKAISRAVRPPLTVYGTLPAFALINQDGQPFGGEQLKGRVWVANFIFTRCPTICPVFTRKMAGVQEATRDLEGLHLVSFSVDPDYDTPEVLTAYAKQHRADPARWTFVTGDPEVIKGTVVDGFKIAMGSNGPVENPESIFHGTHFVLVDRDLQIRGYYNSDDEDAVKRLLDEVEQLADP